MAGTGTVTCWSMLWVLEIQVWINSLIYLFFQLISFLCVPSFSVPAFRHPGVPCFSTTALDLSEKAIFWSQNKHQLLDSVCSKTKLPNRAKRWDQIVKIYNGTGSRHGEGFSAKKKIRSENHQPQPWPFELHVKQTPRSIACNCLISNHERLGTRV